MSVQESLLNVKIERFGVIPEYVGMYSQEVRDYAEMHDTSLQSAYEDINATYHQHKHRVCYINVYVCKFNAPYRKK